MNSMSEDIVLLRSVIVGFLELASLYVSNNTDVADTRESPDRRDPFFANIYVELRSMVENLKFLGPTDNDIPSALQDHMKKVLDALESRCTAKSAVNQTDDPHGVSYYLLFSGANFAKDVEKLVDSLSCKHFGFENSRNKISKTSLHPGFPRFPGSIQP